VRCDLDLLDCWRRGDAEAGQALFARYFDSIYRFFVTRSDGDIDDLVQQTFLACVRARDRFRGDASFRSFLFTIARYELYRYYRQRRHDGEQLDPLTSSVAELVTTPRTRIARDDAHRRLLHAMDHLPLETQMLLDLHYRENLGIAELAHVFDASAATIRTRLHRARRALRELLGTATGSAILDASVSAW
jgi:RNA polymerase sigma factor (sigma-70 family)